MGMMRSTKSSFWMRFRSMMTVSRPRPRFGAAMAASQMEPSWLSPSPMMTQTR